jgi:hypothetical protein
MESGFAGRERGRGFDLDELRLGEVMWALPRGAAPDLFVRGLFGEGRPGEAFLRRLESSIPRWWDRS